MDASLTVSLKCVMPGLAYIHRMCSSRCNCPERWPGSMLKLTTTEASAPACLLNCYQIRPTDNTKGSHSYAGSHRLWTQRPYSAASEGVPTRTLYMAWQQVKNALSKLLLATHCTIYTVTIHHMCMTYSTWLMNSICISLFFHLCIQTCPSIR